MVKIPSGEFLMEGRRGHESLNKVVCIENSFYMADAPVTISQYLELTGCEKPSIKKVSNTTVYKHYETLVTKPIENVENIPVTKISWNESIEFCDILSAKEGKKYRLPTEAEWEYCCRGNISGKLIDILKIQSAFYICGVNNDS